MKKYRITFRGCERGAIGMLYRITETVSADTEDDALLSLYVKYDHIQRPRIYELPTADITADIQ